VTTHIGHPLFVGRVIEREARSWCLSLPLDRTAEGPAGSFVAKATNRGGSIPTVGQFEQRGFQEFSDGFSGGVAPPG
jgi:hypothetical protein